MTTVREAIVLPLTFLTVSLLGGLRIGATVRLLPPPVMALALGVLLLGCLVRSGAFAPQRLINSRRSAMENLSGIVVLLVLYAACAQVFNLVTPEHGLLNVMFSVFFLIQLLTTLAGVASRSGLLRAIGVLLGAAFLLRFVVLESLYAPDTGTMKRVLTALMEGITLGTLQYEPNAALTGYAAFFALTLFMIALVLLPTSGEGTRDISIRPSLPVPNQTLVLVALLCLTACGGGDADALLSRGDARQVSAELRERALQGARVWRQPAVAVAEANLADNPQGPGGFGASDQLSCKFTLQKVGGTTAKFYCEMPSGEVLKVKYGAANPELGAEIAATRLLSVLGFGADRMYFVEKLSCLGCPAFPFSSLKCLARGGLRSICVPGGLDYTQAVDFAPVVIERRMDGTRIEVDENQGWAWFELDRVDPAFGGSPVHELDAFRLMAVFLAHWDNKSENQRLICLAGSERPDGSCARPFAAIQDLGGTFGPLKLDLRNWRATPVWADPKTCRVSMKTLPFGGATFPDRQISDEGRLLLLSLLEQLSDNQIRDLFIASRITRVDAVDAESRSADAWLAAFKDKVRQLRTAGPCPTARGLRSQAGL